MKHLSRLTPAETLLVLTGDKTPLSELLKYTFMDLLLKQVLAVHEVERQASTHDPVRMSKYVAIGKNYHSHPIRLHEAVFLSIFQNSPEVSILFRNIVKISYQRAKSERHYYFQLTSNSNLKSAITASVFQRLLGRFSYTHDGKALKKEIQNEIASVERTVAAYMATDRNRGIDLLKAIGGNVFLLKALEFEILKEFDKELFEEMAKKNSGAGCGGCWTDFRGYSESFDNSCSSDSGTGCSGDGGGSGDSGCSGCGGCGGD